MDYLDLYGKTFNLHTFGQDKYKTVTGSIFGSISLIAIIAISIYFLKDLFGRKNMTLIYNEDSNTIPVNDLSNTPFLLGLADYTGAAIPREGIYSFQVTYVNFTVVQVNGTGVVKPIRTPIVLEKCDINKHFLQYGEMFTQLQVDKGFCVPPGNNIKLYGKYGDLVNPRLVFLSTNATLRLRNV